MRINTTRLGILTALATAPLFTACSGSSGGGGPARAVLESEPNDTSANAVTIKLAQPATGDVSVAGDVDFWRVVLGQGSVYSVTLRAYDFDMATWETADNVPRLTIYAADGATKLAEQDYSGNFSDGWAWHQGDYDIPAFYVRTGGEHFVAVTQDDQLVAGGAYVLEINRVTSFGAITMEAETAATPNSNDTFGTAEPILDGTLLGIHDAGEDDFYSFAVTGPTVVRFETFAYRNGSLNGDDYFDPELELLDTDGTTVLQIVNDIRFYDAGIDYLLETAGTYFLRVNDDGNPQGEGDYLLTFESSDVPAVATEIEPNDTTGTATDFAGTDRGAVGIGEVDFYSFEGEAGDQVRLYVYDDNASSFASSVVVDLLDPTGATSISYTEAFNNFRILNAILQETGTFFIQVNDNGVATDYVLVGEVVESATYETEPNNPQVNQQYFKAKRYAGVIDVAADVDQFSFAAKANAVYEFVCWASDNATDGMADDYMDFGSELIPVLTVRDSGGAALATSASSTTTSQTADTVSDPEASASLLFLAPAKGIYTIEVGDRDGNFGADYFYVIERR